MIDSRSVTVDVFAFLCTALSFRYVRVPNDPSCFLAEYMQNVSRTWSAVQCSTGQFLKVTPKMTPSYRSTRTLMVSHPAVVEKQDEPNENFVNERIFQQQ